MWQYSEEDDVELKWYFLDVAQPPPEGGVWRMSVPQPPRLEYVKLAPPRYDPEMLDRVLLPQAPPNSPADTLPPTLEGAPPPRPELTRERGYCSRWDIATDGAYANQQSCWDDYPEEGEEGKRDE